MEYTIPKKRAIARRLVKKRRRAHNLLKRRAEHCHASADEPLGIDLDIRDRANPDTGGHDNHCRDDLGGVVLAVQHPFHEADHRNHAQFGDLQNPSFSHTRTQATQAENGGVGAGAGAVRAEQGVRTW
jgi:hypothetical protein